MGLHRLWGWVVLRFHVWKLRRANKRMVKSYKKGLKMLSTAAQVAAQREEDLFC